MRKKRQDTMVTYWEILPFRQELVGAHADLLIKLSQSLSYRQLCLLSIFGQKDRFTLRQNDYRDTRDFFLEKVSLLQEIFDLTIEV